MKKSRLYETIPFVLATVIIFSLLGGSRGPVSAATACTWSGAVSTEWYNATNWSGCLDEGSNPKVPGALDDVIIPQFTTFYPVLQIYQDIITLNTLTINTNAQLTIDEQTKFIANQFDNYGTIIIEEVTGHNLRIQAPFNNYGTVNIGSEAALILYKSGIHTGSFSGRQLSFFDQVPNGTNTFETGSSIAVETFMVSDNNIIDINGQFNCTGNLYVTSSSVTISTAGLINLGTPVITDGELIIELDGGSYNPGTNMAIAEGAVFSGNGTLQANLENAGTVSPGTSPGIINIEGVYTQTSAGTLEIELGGTTAGVAFDQLLVTSSATLNGILEVTLIDDFEPTLGNSFTFMNFASRTGTFREEKLPPLNPGLAWEVTYTGTAVTLDVIQAGAISGTVTYTGSKGSNPIVVALFLDYEDAPVYVTNVGSATPEYDYLFDSISMGSYYLAALMDLNNSHDPDPGEPYAFYDANADGEPDLIVVSGSTPIYTDVDFELNDPLSFLFFLPLIVN